MSDRSYTLTKATFDCKNMSDTIIRCPRCGEISCRTELVYVQRENSEHKWLQNAMGVWECRSCWLCWPLRYDELVYMYKDKQWREGDYHE